MQDTKELLRFLRAQRQLVGNMEQELSRAINAACEADSFKTAIAQRQTYQDGTCRTMDTLQRAMVSRNRTLQESLIRFANEAQKQWSGLVDFQETGEAIMAEPQYQDQ